MVEAKKHILTSKGMQALEDELQDLKVVKRKEIAQKIKEAREQGDLSEEELEYRIVGSTESDILKGLISNESPLGKALIGAKVGETVQVESPDGFSRYKILEISRSDM